MKAKFEKYIVHQNYWLDIPNKKLYTYYMEQVSTDREEHNFDKVDILSECFMAERDGQDMLVGFAKAIYFCKKENRIVIT